jgi:hypothetical protein
MDVSVGSVCLLILLLNTHVIVIVFNNKCEVVNSIEDVVQSRVKHVLLWCLFFDVHLTTNQSNMGVQYINMFE